MSEQLVKVAPSAQEPAMPTPDLRLVAWQTSSLIGVAHSGSIDYVSHLASSHHVRAPFARLANVILARRRFHPPAGQR
jgi:hypothetical protein